MMFGEASALAGIASLTGNITAQNQFKNWADFSRAVVLEQHWNPNNNMFSVIPGVQTSNQITSKSAHQIYSDLERKQHKEQNRKPLPEEDDLTVKDTCDLHKERVSNATVHVRELLGYIPWYFGQQNFYGSLIPSEEAVNYAQQFKYLLSDAGGEGFSGPWGLRSCQLDSPCYNYSWEHGDCWNGPSWVINTNTHLSLLILFHSF